jgi:hypothetical protein
MKHEKGKEKEMDKEREKVPQRTPAPTTPPGLLTPGPNTPDDDVVEKQKLDLKGAMEASGQAMGSTGPTLKETYELLLQRKKQLKELNFIQARMIKTRQQERLLQQNKEKEELQNALVLARLWEDEGQAAAKQKAMDEWHAKVVAQEKLQMEQKQLKEQEVAKAEKDKEKNEVAKAEKDKDKNVVAKAEVKDDPVVEAPTTQEAQQGDHIDVAASGEEEATPLKRSLSGGPDVI